VNRFVLRSSLLLGSLFFLPVAHAQFPAAPGTGPGLPETIEAIDGARVTTRILYITAHPDDESAAMLTYLARGLHADVALLTLTRGEGGQNALGPEQAPQLGLIRTQELLAATRGYGVKLYFTRAKDFGYSKTVAETEKIWGDEVLEDMVRVIREFRPNIVINGWGGVHSGHGHHQTSALWTPKAVQLAADPSSYADLAKEGLSPWSIDGEPPVVLDADRGSDKLQGYVLPVDEVSPLYGKSWRQIGLDAFVNHHSQGIAGFLGSSFLRRPIPLKREDGKNFDPSTLAVPLPELLGKEDGKVCSAHKDWCDALKHSDQELSQARAAALTLDFSVATNLLADVQKRLTKILPPGEVSADERNPNLFQVALQVERVTRALRLAAGFFFEAEADRSEVVIGEPVSLTVSYHCRPGVQCPFQGPLVVTAGKQFQPTGGDPAQGVKFQITLGAAPQAPPVWMQLSAEARPIIFVSIKEQIDAEHEILVPTNVFYPYASSTTVARVPLRIVPAYTLSVQPTQAIEVLNSKHKPFDILLRVHSYSTKAAKVSVGLDLPDGLTSTFPAEVSFDGVGDQYAKLTVNPPAKLDAGNFTITAYAKRGDDKFTTSLEPLPSMPTVLWSEPAQCVVHAFDINVPPNLRVGYISAEGEPIPEALRRLGINVDLLDAAALAFGNLSSYDAIVVGVRAYELRPELTGANKRLLDYVSNGGTLVVQYNRDYIWDRAQPAPYPAKIGSPTPRITDENSPVKFLKADDPLLNRPNKITQADFQNWKQERGLYFWSDFDAKYTPVLAMNDPGEKDLNGGIVYTRYGKGTYIYTGLAFFRELPDGVPGAYRLFVNLLSASKAE
jgi:LmbE family N-acetylglucosaminyl deacetylase